MPFPPDNVVMHLRRQFHSFTRALVLLFVGLALLSSCSKKAEKAQTSFALHMAALSAPLYDQGGAMVMGVEQKSGHSFSLDVRSQDSIDLTPGSWTFYAIGWTGSAPLTGTPRCDELAMEIGNEATEVSMSLTNAKCLSAGFGQLLSLNMVSCDSTSLAAASSLASNCDSSPGSALSYQVEILNYDSGALATATGTSASSLSACQDMSGTSVHPTPWSIPLLGAAGLFKFKLKAFDTLGCAGNELTGISVDGQMSSLDPLIAKSFADSSEIRLFLNDWTTPPAPVISSVSPIGGLAGGGDVITIAGSNFYNSTVTIGGVNCVVGTVTSTSITCTTGAATIGIYDVVVTNVDLQATTATSAYEYGAIPTVTSVTPSFGAVSGGTTVTLSGTGFSTHGGVPLIDIGGANCGGVVVVDPATITCTTTAATTGLKMVTLTTASSLSGNLANAYTYQASPTVTSLSPNYSRSTGGDTINIAGTNFSNLGGSPTVTINGVACTSVVYTDPTNISCTTGASSSGAFDVIVTNADGQSSTGQTMPLTYQDPPTLVSVSPFSGTLTGGNTIVITGTNFSALGGAPTVTIDGNACTSVVVTDASTLSCTVPTGTVGPKTVSVTNMDGQVASLINFYEYNEAPIVSGLSQSYAFTAGGETLTVNGSNFTNFMGTPTVTIGGSACSSVTFTSATSLDCVGTPALAAGTYDVVVTNPNGESYTSVGAITYQDPPNVTSLSINYGNPGGGDTITVYGSNFSTVGGNPNVTIGGYTCGAVAFVNTGELTCITGTATAGSYEVVVTNMDGQVSAGGPSFTYLAPPTISSVSPHVGIVESSTLITISGTNFTNLGPGMSVMVGGMTCSGVSFVSATEINCNTDSSLSTGDYTVSVTGPDSQNTSMASAFTVGSFYLGSSVSKVALTSSNILAVVDDNFGLELYQVTDYQTVSARQAIVSGVGTVYDVEAISTSMFAVLGSSGSTLYLIDASTPSAPTTVGSLSLGASFYTMAVSGSSLFVGGAAGNFKVVDITTYASPAIIYTGTVGTGSIGQMDVLSTTLGVANGDSFHLLDISTPSSPVAIGSSLTVSGITGYTGFAFIDSSTVALAGTGDIQTVDISTPSSPVSLWTGSLSFSSVTKAYVEGSTLYAIGNQAIGTFDVTTPGSPTINTPLMVETVDVATNGSLMVAAMKGAGVRFFSGSLTPSPVNLHGYLGGTPSHAVVDETNDRLYLAAGKQINAIDITNPFSPVLLGSYIEPNSTGIKGLALHGGYVYYANANSSNNIKILDFSTPASPTLVGTPPSISGTIYNFAISGNVITIAKSSGGTVEVYEITDINTITFMTSVASASGISQATAPTSSRSFLSSGTMINEVDFTSPGSAYLVGSHSTTLSSFKLVSNATESALVAYKSSSPPEFFDITSAVSSMSTGGVSDLTSAVFGINSYQDTLFAIVGTSTLYCFDTSSLSSVSTLSSTSLVGSTHTVLGHDGADALYLGNSKNLLRVVSIRDSGAPIAP